MLRSTAGRSQGQSPMTGKYSSVFSSWGMGYLHVQMSMHRFGSWIAPSSDVIAVRQCHYLKLESKLLEFERAVHTQCPSLLFIRLDKCELALEFSTDKHLKLNSNVSLQKPLIWLWAVSCRNYFYLCLTIAPNNIAVQGELKELKILLKIGLLFS